jgi:hypothetical protein
MTISKPAFHGVTFSFSPASLLARFVNAVKSQTPTGYQDETGFHNGVKADEQEANWPTTW